jgi:hypothetical protein
MSHYGHRPKSRINQPLLQQERARELELTIADNERTIKKLQADAQAAAQAAAQAVAQAAAQQQPQVWIECNTCQAPPKKSVLRCDSLLCWAAGRVASAYSLRSSVRAPTALNPVMLSWKEVEAAATPRGAGAAPQDAASGKWTAKSQVAKAHTHAHNEHTHARARTH